MEQTLADSGDGEELLDTKVGGVLSTDKVCWLSQVCLQCAILALACSLCVKSLTLQRIDAHTWKKV